MEYLRRRDVKLPKHVEIARSPGQPCRSTDMTSVYYLGGSSPALQVLAAIMPARPARLYLLHLPTHTSMSWRACLARGSDVWRLPCTEGNRGGDEYGPKPRPWPVRIFDLAHKCMYVCRGHLLYIHERSGIPRGNNVCCTFDVAAREIRMTPRGSPLDERMVDQGPTTATPLPCQLSRWT